MATETDVTQHIFAILDSVLGQQQQQQFQQQQFEGATTSADVPSFTAPSVSVPLKRKPGRPKGSVTVNRRNPNDPPKVKGPIGRPRKDGQPPGASRYMLNKMRAELERNASAQLSLPGGTEVIVMENVEHQALPQGGDNIPMESNESYSPFDAADGVEEQVPAEDEPHAMETTPSVDSNNIDPSLLEDEWLTLLRANEERFLHALISALNELPYPPAASGTTVETAFRAHLVSLSPKENRQQPSAPDTPSLYSVMKTFWLPTSPSYFSLTASSSTSRTPSEHRFVYWDPLPLLFNGLACPKCAALLANKGRIQTGPIMVHDLERPFYIIGCKYTCTNADCKSDSSDLPSTYASTDGRILRILPEFLKKEFPAHLAKSVKANDVEDGELGPDPSIWSFKALGVSRALWNMVRGCVGAGAGMAAVLSVIDGIRGGHPKPPRARTSIDEEIQKGNRAWSLETQLAYAESPLPHDSLRPSEEPSSGASFSAPQTDRRSSTPAELFIGNGPSPVANHPITIPSNYPLTTPANYAQGHDTGNFFSIDPSVSRLGLRFLLSSATAGMPGAKPPRAQTSVKHIRHCRKCGVLTCRGRGGRAYCKSPCRDCRTMECPGRRGRNPDKPCAISGG